MNETVIKNGIEYVKCGDYYLPIFCDDDTRHLA